MGNLRNMTEWLISSWPRIAGVQIQGSGWPPPAASGQKGPHHWHRSVFRTEWNQTLGCWKRVEVERGGEWITSGRPCPWSPTTDAHRWKTLDLHSSTKMDGLLDREAEWSGRRKWKRGGGSVVKETERKGGSEEIKERESSMYIPMRLEIHIVCTSTK